MGIVQLHVVYSRGSQDMVHVTLAAENSYLYVTRLTETKCMLLYSISMRGGSSVQQEYSAAG